MSKNPKLLWLGILVIFLAVISGSIYTKSKAIKGNSVSNIANSISPSPSPKISEFSEVTIPGLREKPYPGSPITLKQKISNYGTFDCDSNFAKSRL